MSLKTPLPESKLKTNPSHAELSILVFPSSVFSCSSAIFLAAPPALFKPISNSFVTSTPSANTKNDVADLLPTNSVAVDSLSLLFAIFSKAESKSIPAAFNSINPAFKAVPALLPLIPAFAKVPSNAVVFSMSTPTAFAAGAASFIDSLNFSKSKADVLNDLAITSVTLAVSAASKPKPPSVAPAIAAASPNSEPVAAARFRVASVAFKISCSLNPNFANSVCS